MTIEEKLEYIESTVFHELGHLIGYCLANKFEDTTLGKVKSVEIGFPRNCVVPEKSFYHVEHDLLKEKDRIEEATKNVNRTIAWFVEVIAGCTFQSTVEGKNFKDCFGYGPDYDGGLDFGNLSTVRSVCSFKWNFDELGQLQSELSLLMSEEDLIVRLSPLVERLLNEIKESPMHQIKLDGNKLSELIDEIDDLISIKLIHGYRKLVDKYNRMFTAEADFLAELTFRSLEQGGRITPAFSGYRPTVKFEFSDKQTSGSQRYLRRNFANPGEVVPANIKLASPEFFEKKLKQGDRFEFREGPKIIGIGRIIKILNDKLESSPDAK